MLTTFYPPYHFGGDAIYVQSLAHALADRGDRVTVVHCIDSHRVLAGGTDAGVAESHPGVRVVSLSSRVAALSPTFTYLTGHAGVKERTLQRLFASESFDVVHFHNISLLGLAVLALGTGVKLYTLHDHWLVCPMHVLWKDNREVCLKPSCIRCGLAFRRPPQPWRATGLLKRQLEHVDRFIASSASVFDSHRQRGLDLPGSVVPLFVADPGPVATTRRPPSRFLYVGRLEPIKGVDTLVDAFAGAPELELTIAGTGSAELELRRRAAGLPNVEFTGRVDHERLAGLYGAATALIVPSVGFETGPLVIAEAFSHGTPVVGRGIGGIEEALAGGGGFTYETNSELVVALRAFAGDAQVREDTGARARGRFLERHTADAHLDSLDDVVDQVTAAGVRATPRSRASPSSA